MRMTRKQFWLSLLAPVAAAVGIKVAAKTTLGAAPVVGKSTLIADGWSGSTLNRGAILMHRDCFAMCSEASEEYRQVFDKALRDFKKKATVV